MPHIGTSIKTHHFRDYNHSQKIREREGEIDIEKDTMINSWIEYSLHQRRLSEGAHERGVERVGERAPADELELLGIDQGEDSEAGAVAQVGLDVAGADDPGEGHAVSFLIGGGGGG